MKECKKWSYYDKILSPEKYSEISELKSYNPERAIYTNSNSDIVPYTKDTTWFEHRLNVTSRNEARAKREAREDCIDRFRLGLEIEAEERSKEVKTPLPYAKAYTPLPYNNGKRGKDRFNFDSVKCQKIGKPE